jgi:predicted acylesterase/phospholipase RssA
MSSCEGAFLKPARLQISFGGCSALVNYHVGVFKCLIDHNLLDEFEQLYGASAGALIAVCTVCKCDPLTIYEWIMEIFKVSKEYILGAMSPSFNLLSRMRDFLEATLPQDAHRLCRNRVHISLSVFDGFGLPKNWLLTDFTTRKELINVRHSSNTNQ